ncbi:hypothetical protein BH09PSE5_BH09PSE5_45140 [soil metagenome]
MEKLLPSIPAKRYFTIGEVSDLCGVKPYVLRYWEQEFSQLKPMKRRGNRRYYQHHEVLLIRRIRELLYDQGFTISGARNRLLEMGHFGRSDEDEAGDPAAAPETAAKPQPSQNQGLFGADHEMGSTSGTAATPPRTAPPVLALQPQVLALREELMAIRALLLD